MGSTSQLEAEIDRLALVFSRMKSQETPNSNSCFLFQTFFREANDQLKKLIMNPDLDQNLALSLRCRYFDGIETLVENCDVDLNKLLPIEIDCQHETPLEYAVRKDDLQMLELLIELGADVGIPSSKLHPGALLVYACKLRRCRIIKYFTDCCNSDENSEMDDSKAVVLQMIKARNYKGNTALHYSVRYGEVEISDILLNNGADVRCKNNNGDDVLRYACIYGWRRYAIKLMKLGYTKDIERQIESYQLLGCFEADFIIDGAAGDDAFDMWERAIKLRLKYPMLEIPTAAPNPVYDSVEEARTLGDIEDMHYNEMASCMQALTLREKILGPQRKLTFDRILRRSKSFWQKDNFQVWFRLLEYAFEISQSSLLTQEEKDKRLFAICFSLKIGKLAPPNQISSKLSELLHRILPELKDVLKRGIDKAFKYCNKRGGLQKLCHGLMIFCCWVLRANTQLNSLKQFIIEIVKIGLKCHNPTLPTYFVCNFFDAIPQFHRDYSPDFDAIEVLLKCGVDFEVSDVEGNTLLHKLHSTYRKQRESKHQPSKQQISCTEYQRMVKVLQHHGAHLDARNVHGEKADSILRALNMDIPNLPSLRCLSARQIRLFNIPFRGIIPSALNNFVQMH